MNMVEIDTTTNIAPIIYKGYCPFCDQGFGMEEGDNFTYIMGNRCITCPTCGKSIIIPAFDDNNDGFLTQDENTLFPIFSNPNYFKKEDGGGSGGSDSGDSTVVIYNGDIVLTTEYYEGTFVPLVVPESGTESSPSTLTVLFNGHEYNLIEDGERTWVDDQNLANLAVNYVDEEWYFIVVNNDLLPSTELPQTVSVKITQEQSSGGSGDFSIANVTFINNGSPYVVICPYIDDDYMTLDNYVIMAEMTLQIPLYKGLFILGFNNFENVDFSVTPTISGEISMDGSQFEITGDGTITMKGNANPISSDIIS